MRSPLIEASIDAIVNQLMTMGYTGIYSIMFLAGSILPIPWDLVLILIGTSEYDPFYSSILAGFGVSLGAAVGYYLGQIIGRPLLSRYGRYILLKENNLVKAEKWINKWGAPSTFLLRSIQYMPYKTFNFIAGISKMDFKKYMVLTIVGSTIRCTYLIYIGKMTNISPTIMIIIAVILLLVGLLVPLSQKT